MHVKARLQEYEWLKLRLPRAPITLGSVTPTFPPAPEIFALLPGRSRR